MAPPFVVRWRNAVMDDPLLSSRAKVAAMPLARHANSDGKDCYPGAKRCAKEMSVSQDTIWRGWAELEEAGWMEMQPLPATRRREQGALKVLKFASNSPADSGDVDPTHPLTGANSPADSKPTSEGNREDLSDPRGPCEDCGAPSVTHNFGADLCPECAQRRWEAT